MNLFDRSRDYRVHANKAEFSNASLARYSASPYHPGWQLVFFTCHKQLNVHKDAMTNNTPGDQRQQHSGSSTSNDKVQYHLTSGSQVR